MRLDEVDKETFGVSFRMKRRLLKLGLLLSTSKEERVVAEDVASEVTMVSHIKEREDYDVDDEEVVDDELGDFLELIEQHKGVAKRDRPKREAANAA